MMNFDGQVIIVTGSTRGIGKAIAMKCASLGAKVVITGKTTKPHKILPGTIAETRDEIIAAGGEAIAVAVDVRDDAQIDAMVKTVIDHWGRIDKLVNNASAIVLNNTEALSMRRFDLMFDCNVRGTYACSQACAPYLLKSKHAHILNLSPPLNLDPKWFKDHTAYTISKYGMSLCTLGMAAEFQDRIAVNALWPKSTIATMAIKAHFPEAVWQGSRWPNIMADAAAQILGQDCAYSGQFLIDEAVLTAAGMTDFSAYAVDQNVDLHQDLFLD